MAVRRLMNVGWANGAMALEFAIRLSTMDPESERRPGILRTLDTHQHTSILVPTTSAVMPIDDASTVVAMRSALPHNHFMDVQASQVAALPAGDSPQPPESAPRRPSSHW